MSKHEPVFTPKQLANATEFVEDKDIIPIVTKADQVYTKAQVKALIEQFRNKEVE